MDINALYRLWLEKAAGHPALREELEAIRGDDAAIEDRFYRELEFGTGGLRGVLGAGTNRMNVFTVGKATQGYANYLKAHFAAPSVAIAYDSRINSRLFAETTAGVFAANGIRVHIYPRLMPTPSLSFAVRDLRSCGGVVITASHNPAKYNGYKVYGADGCQITTEAAAAIQQEIDRIDPFADVHTLDFAKGLASGVIAYIGEDTVERYLAAVSTASLLPEDVSRSASIVYTPLNGTGISCVPRCLRAHGFTNISIPPEQAEPDGTFPTCPYPNPEIREALSVGLRLAEETGSELLLATDPDCDRVGIAVKDDAGKYYLMTGNQIGCVLLYYILKSRKALGNLPADGAVVKSVVSTELARKIAESFGLVCFNTLTGFKWIAEKIQQFKEKGDHTFVFGFEESYGFLSSTFVRDKDGVNASLLIAEAAAWAKTQGKTLYDILQEIYKTYGYYVEKVVSVTLPGKDGVVKMKEIMKNLRENPPKELAGKKVLAVRDYLADTRTDCEGNVTAAGLPKSDVLYFELVDDAWVCIRPSGTEPKIKLYVNTNAGNPEDSAKENAELVEACKALMA